METAVIVPGQEIKELVESLREAVTVLQGKDDKSNSTYLGNEEFMQLLGISKRTAQNWRDEGLIAFSQVGGKIYYSRADIDKLMQEHRREQFCELAKRKGGKL